MKQKNAPYNQITPYTDFADLLRKHAVNHAEETAFAYEEHGKQVQVTYQKLWDDVRALGTYFRTLGLEKANIALVGKNCYAWIVSYFAATVGGNVIFPLDRELSAEELQTLIEASECELFIYGGVKKDAVPMIESLELPHKLTFDKLDDAIAIGAEAIENGDHFIENYSPALDEVCAIIYTSGTTGSPKGVMLSQRNLMSDALHSMENLSFPRGTVLVLPLNHTFGFMSGVLCQIWGVSPVYINESLHTVLKSIQTAKPGHISVVPLFVKSFYKNIWRNAEKQGKAKALRALIATSNKLRKVGIDMRRVFFKSVLDAFGGNLQMIIAGGAPIEEFYMKAFDDFGIQLINGYGITECSPIVATNRMCWVKSGSVGLPIPGIHAKIDDPNEDGEGEICIKGDIVMKGYYKNQTATDNVLNDGWFSTGDIGKIDVDGFLFITGRKKNMILTANGKNVYPEELEELLSGIENITEVIVYSEAETITAEIYSEAGNECHDQIKKDIMELNKKLAGYKQIRKIKFRAVEFEKTATKKIKR